MTYLQAPRLASISEEAYLAERAIRGRLLLPFIDNFNRAKTAHHAHQSEATGRAVDAALSAWEGMIRLFKDADGHAPLCPVSCTDPLWCGRSRPVPS